MKKIIMLSIIITLCFVSCINSSRNRTSNINEYSREVQKQDSKTVIDLLKEAGWTEYCTVKATNINARSVHDNYQKIFVILYKDNIYAAIPVVNKYKKYSSDYSPSLLSASRGTFKIPTDDGYITYTGRVIGGNGTHFYFDF